MNLNRSIERERSARIWKEIQIVLMRDWDPIGVKEEPMAADEYDGYIGEIFGLLSRDSSDQLISEHLRAIEIKRMGYAEEQVPTNLDVARKLKQISLD